MSSYRYDNVCLSMTTPEPAFLSVAEAAQTLGLSETTVRRRVVDGSLPCLRLSEHGAIRIPRTAIELGRAVHLLPRRSEIPGERDVPEAGQSTASPLTGSAHDGGTEAA